MKKFLKQIIEEVLNPQKINFSQQEILQDNTTRVIGFVELNSAPEKGSILAIEKTNVKGEKYFKNYIVENSTIVIFENGKKEGFLYLKFIGIQNI